MVSSQKEYNELATIYDQLVAEVDYEDWFDYLQQILKRVDHSPATVADLACGTGETTIPFAKEGIKAYGIDISEEMLDIARQKASDYQEDIIFLEQDMKKLELPEDVDLIVCYHDGLNYILSFSDLCQVFKQAYKNLDNGGYFIFDLNSVNRFSKANDDNGVTIIDEEDRYLIWQTDYDNIADIWTIELTGFIKQKDNLYRKFTEVHKEKHYSEGEVLTALRKAGFKVVDYYEAFSWQRPKLDSPRIFYVAKKGRY